MKYAFEIEIDVPYRVMIQLLEDPANLPSWQPELTSHTLLAGTQGQVGAQSKLTYSMNGRPMEITELVTVRDLPNERSSRYDAPGMIMHVTSRFADIGPESTFWRHESEIEFTNFLTRLVAFFMPDVFRNQSWRYMNLFKRFAEQTYEGERSSLE